MTTAKVAPVKIEDTMKKTLEAWNKRDVKAVGNHYAMEGQVHDPMYPQPLRGRAAIQKDAEDFFKAFPDIQFKMSNLLTKGNFAAAQVTMTGTHKGPLTGPTGTIPATNKRLNIEWAVFFRVNAQGQIAEEWRYGDTGTFMQQLGITDKS